MLYIYRLPRNVHLYVVVHITMLAEFLAVHIVPVLVLLTRGWIRSTDGMACVQQGVGNTDEPQAHVQYCCNI